MGRASDESKKIRDNVESTRETMDELLFATRDFANEARASAKAVFDNNVQATAAAKAFKDISKSLAEQSAMFDDIVDGNITLTDLTKTQNKYAKTQAKFQVEYRQALNKTKLTQTQINKILSGQLDYEDAILNDLDGMDSSLSSLLDKYNEQSKINKENLAIMDKMAKRAKNIDDGLGLAGKTVSGLGSVLKKAGLGDIGDKMGLDKAAEEGRKLSAELTNGGAEAAGMGTKLKVAGKMAGTIGKNLAKSFGPVAIIALLLKEMISAVKEVDEAAGKLGKNLGISYNQALKLGGEYREMARTSKDMMVTGNEIAAAQDKLNEKFETGGKFSAEISTQFAAIQKRTNLSDKAMGFLVKGQIKGSKTIKSQLKDLNKTVTQFNIQNKMVLNVNKVMEKITKASKSIHLFTKGNVKELAKTVMMAQKFGAEMSTIEGIGNSLLDFESSIAAELEAELMLGQDINLEKARSAALTGDMATLTKEIMNQEAIMNAFATDNVLAQQSAAAALGLSREQLAEIVMSQKEQEALQKTFGEGVTDVNGAYEKYREMRANDMTDEEIFKTLGDENLQKQLESLSKEEELAQIKETQRDLMRDAAQSFLSSIGSVKELYKQFKGVAKVIGAIVIAYKTFQITSGIVLGINQLLLLSKKKQNQATVGGMAAESTKATILGAQATAQVASASAGTLGIGAATIIAGIAAVMAAAIGYGMMSDGVIGPGGEMMVSGPKGSIQLDKDDSIIAGTNLMGGGGGGGNSEAMQRTLNEANVLLASIAAKETTIEMGGNEVGQGINTAERAIQ